MKYTPDEIKNITDSASVLDYFLYLERNGKVKFERKSGKDYYFRTENNKFSVSEKKFFDFKTKIGGGAIKAVMGLENKSWKETIDFLKDFNNIPLSRDLSEIKEKWKKLSDEKSTIEIQKTLKPNNGNLIDYFAERGIDREILSKYTEQVHYKMNDKYYFGIGLKNESGGYEIRNPYVKTKIGTSDFSLKIGEKNDEMMIFEGMTDMLSYLQLQKNKNLETKRTLVTLNSVTNADKFIEKFKNFNGKIFLALDKDDAGDEATKHIIAGLPNAKSKDIRPFLGLEHKQDLNDFLLKNFGNQKNIPNLVDTNENRNEYKQSTQSTGIPTSQPMGKQPSERNAGKFSENSQSKQGSDNPRGQNLGSNDAGNGFRTSEPIHLGGERRTERTGTSASSQPQNATVSNLVQENGGGQISNSLGFREGTDGRQSGSENREFGKNDNEHNRDNSGGRILSHREYASRGRLSNEDIAEIINSYAYVSENKKVLLKDETIPEEIKETVTQFKSGGITKDGRGVLDEYYTEHQIVDAVRNLIKDQFKGKSEISVLEPSVGTGNFLQATKDLGLKVNITAFEINETSAKISKILYPNANINLRSFETEFIDDKGQKKGFEEKYDLVIGNPPYGNHRGYYKGLGEESKIARYEDYFVKRSLDVMKDGAVLAMVLPSGWLNRQNRLQNAELTDAYRLPNGAFKGTNVGTDIIILKKNSLQQGKDISNYFNENPTKLLGETATKTNQWNREVEYVKGSLEEALEKLYSSKNLAEIKQEIQQEQTNEVKEIVGDLWGNWAEENAEEWKKEQPILQQEKKSSEWDLEFDKASKNLSNAISVLENMRFKSLAVQNKLSNFKELQENLTHDKNSFTLDDLKGISEKSEKTIQLKNTSKSSAANLIQGKPEIKKGVLKYQFNKPDEVVSSNIQNNSEMDKEKLTSFEITSYDGNILFNEPEMKKYANLYKGEYIHDFYYTEGDIYEKLEQLERDFAGDRTEEQQKQYEKQKAILENVLPEKKPLEDIIISPNHEFVHHFSLGEIEKDVFEISGYNPYTGKTTYESTKKW